MAVRASSARLVGREGELARLRAAVADAAGGRSRFVLVAGDAGIGKTRLTAELVRSPATDVHALVGRCLAIADGGLPYAPLAGALRRLGEELPPADLDRALGPARLELARLVPGLAVEGPPGAGSPDTAADRAGRARLFELVLGFLGRLGADRPVLFIVEDLHWADDATRDLITYLVGNLGAERVALVATLRTDAVGLDPGFGAWLVELERASGAERVDLGPLSAQEVADQVGGILGSPPRPRVAAEIATRSGGNALFVEALVAAGAGSSPDGGADDTTAARLPDTLREMLAARIRDLPPATAAVIRTLAVAGRAVDDRLLATATGLPAATVDGAIRDAVARRLVVVDPRGSLVDVYHVLLREAIVADILGGERRALHAALATALAARPELADPSPAGAAGEIAHHWSAADRPVEAFRAARTAADAALAVRAFAEAARHRRRALDLLPRLPAGIGEEVPGEVALLLDAEEAANLAGDFTASVDLLERAQRLVDPLADPTRAGIVESRLGYHRWLAGRSEEALDHHRRAVDLVPADPPSLVRARVVRGLGGALMGLGRYRESAVVCEAAIEAARAAAAPIEEGRALDMLGMDRVGIGDVEGGIEALVAACDLARVHDPGEGLIVGLQNLAYHLGLADRPEDALAAATEGIAAARREGLDRRYGLTLRAAAADVLLRLGRWDEADALAAEGRALDPGGEGPLYLVIVRLRLATARGRFDDAHRALEVANVMAAADVDFDLVAYLRTAEAELACWAGRPDLAAVAVDAGLAALEGSDDVFLAAPLLALGLRAAADRAETARAWRDEAALADCRAAVTPVVARLDGLATGARGGAGSTPRGFRATVAWARAEAGRAQGVADEATWGSLAEAWQGLGQPAQEAYARWRRAEALLAVRGRRRAAAAEPATAELASAAHLAARLGAEPLAAAIGGLARRTGVRLPAAVVVGEAARTFLFTDIVGSTALLETIGDDAWTALRAWHDATLRRLFAAHGGVEVDHAGDGFFVAFPAPGPAVACASEIQRTLAEHRQAAGFAPGVRIGLHHGAAVRTGTGWAGRAVHVAARLMARAGAGEIIASASTLEAAGRTTDGAEPVRLPGLAGTVAAAAVPWR